MPSLLADGKDYLNLFEQQLPGWSAFYFRYVLRARPNLLPLDPNWLKDLTEGFFRRQVTETKHDFAVLATLADAANKTGAKAGLSPVSRKGTVGLQKRREFNSRFLLDPICRRKGDRPKLLRRAIEFEGNSERSIPGTSYSDYSAVLSRTHSWICE